ncbi:MAG: tRNA (adenosine(37)-N6)-dimethylallyltransferase MiaA [Clostridia bacterium]|nr:tRNA (adenosine(37)-N6)-dimethylallyltransferase MiaA [Clostridia bacterium]
MRKTIVIICGPTAVGKTAASIELAKKLNGEIVSADSMQIYKYFDIGSAKPTAEEMGDIKHHLIDEIDPRDEFSVAEYRKQAQSYIQEIFEKGKLPIIVGGTGLYINALMYEMDFSGADSDPEYREELNRLWQEKGGDFLHQQLAQIDPEAASRIHANNVKRVIRALEVNKMSGENMSDFKTDLIPTKEYDVILIGLKRLRMKLYAAINKRVDIMLENGLIDEIKNLKTLGLNDKYVSMQGIGYKEVLPYLDGKYSYEQMVSTIKQNSRRYAKRQLTWFRRYDSIKWFDYDQCGSLDEYLSQIEHYVREKIAAD